MNLLDNLNEMQKKAVTTTDGPLLILAGAGSGKTTVLVSRLAYILSEKNVSPYRILAITFTNKAANEMKERIRAKIGDIAEHMWIGTFHSVCVRILRSNIAYIGYRSDFLIYDTNDSKLVIKECLKELNADDKEYTVRAVMSEISNAKDSLQPPEIYKQLHAADIKKRKIGEIYELYQKKLKKNNALDFDDLINKTIQVLSEIPDVLEEYREKFKYIMVDEYQDTNNAQYMLISLLAGKYKNLCVVGDDDQSIYKFRGANIQNILGFEMQYPQAETIRLEQNYRSTQNILDAANAVIANNCGRKGKNLWTDKGLGEKIKRFTAQNEHEEGRYIAEKVAEHVSGGGHYGDCAVLYRLNAQSRIIEEMLMRSGIPYRVLGGLRFYDRKEIKDMVAYLRIIYNPSDDVCVKRVINEPKRGIGAVTVDKAQKIANDRGISLYEVLKNAAEYDEIKRSAAKIDVFVKIMDELCKASEKVSLSELLTMTMDITGYKAMVDMISERDGTSKSENLLELLSAIKQYEEDSDGTLADFLENIALVSDTDNYDKDEDSVVLMTVHSAKGLEFPIVFLPGLEEGLFPGEKSIGEEEELEEERRLCYVAITRAKERLFIINSQERMVFGKTMPRPVSRFVKEIPGKCLEYEAEPQINRRANQIDENPQKWRDTTLSKGKNKFNVGDRVLHRKFGEGTVTGCERFGDDYKLDVVFDSCGKKLLMSNFAKLEKIEN